jgi:hypothetical protein
MSITTCFLEAPGAFLIVASTAVTACSTTGKYASNNDSHFMLMILSLVVGRRPAAAPV